MEGDRSVYALLKDRGVADKRAVQLQNLAIHCGFAEAGYDVAEGDLWVLSEELSRSRTLKLVALARTEKRTVVLMNPYASREREALCRMIRIQHPSTTVDNRAYLLIFNNHLPKQHFRI